MNLEQIDTSTTAGKIRVMELAEQGRKVAYSARHATYWVPIDRNITWNWHSCDYAIISEPVGPEEVWVVELNGRLYANEKRDACQRLAADVFSKPVRYIRADLTGEGK
ncbi:hypothetical protein ORG27_12315 [Stenotrophomonas lactitubi]|uniref:hypothetical protein n=1 Tax=Stenotrophomonas lactitubi TaxID=2045214 RepID=UPI002248EAF9|nr:hypothetical protein [Stenotrophomonas lactitubi]MCX2894361.1 hypothetical protein [Stenotrophomonas lactitubi]